MNQERIWRDLAYVMVIGASGFVVFFLLTFDVGLAVNRGIFYTAGAFVFALLKKMRGDK